MYNVAFRILKDTAAAEDAMQEGFITAFSKLCDFKGTATFGSWLKRIVINNSLTAYKKAKRYVPLEEGMVPETADIDPSDESEHYNSISAAEILESMDSLHDSYKHILSLHFIEGFDYEEICEIKQISYANCRTLISRAKESLRKKLAVAS